jgi:hypothetical protein
MRAAHHGDFDGVAHVHAIDILLGNLCIVSPATTKPNSRTHEQSHTDRRAACLLRGSEVVEEAKGLRLGQAMAMCML